MNTTSVSAFAIVALAMLTCSTAALAQMGGTSSGSANTSGSVGQPGDGDGTAVGEPVDESINRPSGGTRMQPLGQRTTGQPSGSAGTQPLGQRTTSPSALPTADNPLGSISQIEDGVTPVDLPSTGDLRTRQPVRGTSDARTRDTQPPGSAMPRADATPGDNSDDPVRTLAPGNNGTTSPTRSGNNPGVNATGDADSETETRDTRDQFTVNTDNNTSARIRKSIADSPGVISPDSRNVTVQTLNGRVTLRGFARTADEKRSIGEAAAEFAELRDIDNQIQVR